MLVPVCCDRLPVRLEVAVIAATGLPVMNKSINCTDAFVEVRFADEIHKTDVVTSLNPQWDSDLFLFDTDEKQLSECGVQFRVMDHDTYSANDAIGRINMDVNIIAEKMRMQELERIDETHTLPIYDTLNGNRGELIFRVKLHLLVDMDWKNYVQILSVHHLKCEKDPDYEWLDRIRTPRATNEARQSAMRDALKNAAVSLAHKVHKYQCSLICGYREYLDTEGSSTDLFTVRVLGTALRIEKGKNADTWSERVDFPILTISEVPQNRQCGTGAIVAVRAVHILEDDDDDPELTRKSWWNDLRAECHQQAVAVGCNLIIGYSEQFTVLPFIDHDLYSSLICEAKSLNPNANVIFDVHCTYSMSDSILVCVVTGVLVRLICLSRDVSLSPSLSKVHSLTNLQQANDAKRFSWGTVREAMRFKPSASSSITLKILNLKPPRLDFGEDIASRSRLHLNTFVGKIRRRQHEKQYVSHVVFDRHLSTSIGLLDPATACNSTAIAGMHLSPNLRNSLLIKEGNQQTRILTRWSDVFIREDLTNTVKDSQSVDSFVTNVLDERISMARCVAAMGSLAQENSNGRSFGSALSNFRIATPQFSVSKEHAHMIVLMSCDVNSYELFA
ncbi:unnamed protein product [Angiostrongylus costaricensis]|uniref:C2 domain-containing protein n=1 Tax=Angiostrongylus costaricensis TaxID=334426 RepID=A0A158PFC5_ANGCS|nr:unnamed protein product [Angiostrongylus costaricensis]